MIAVRCKECGRRSLLPLSMVTAFRRRVDNDRVVYELEFTCWCGAAGRKTITGPPVQPLSA